MPDFTSHPDVIALQESAQEADHDIREIVREAHHFLDKRDGQWEPEIWNKFKTFGRPRYTFDQCNPVVDQIAGEMEQADFDIKCLPADGEATKDLAKTFDGMIRNIENISNAGSVFSAAGRSMVAAGMDGWRVTQEWADGDSFEQDLFIRKVANYVDRVWFDPAAEMQNCSDAKYAFVLQSMPLATYKEKWPDGSESSVSDDQDSQVYSYKQQDIVMVGEFLYLDERERELVLMSNNAVYVDDEKFQQVKDDLAAKDITEVKRRKRMHNVCVSRLYDAGGWLTEPADTVFEFIPVIPTYGNFKISENKRIVRGAIEKLLDSQRVLNYALSRDIEQGALAPRDKIWMTEKQAEGHKAKLATLNTNTDPVQLFKPDMEAPQGPYRPTAATPNMGLQTTAANMTQAIQQASGISPVAKGDNPGLQSGVAIEALQQKTDTQTIKWFTSQEIAIQHTAHILIKAIPKVYDTRRQVRILGEDGTTSMVMLNDEVFDDATQSMVTLNNLGTGKYDVVCSSGPSFVNRQQQTVAAINEIAALDPTILQTGRDVLLSSIDSPGIDIIAERVRLDMVMSGSIPEDQLTEDEIELVQKKAAEIEAQGQQPTPEQMIGQAEMTKAQTEAGTAQFNQQVKGVELQNENIRLQQSQQKLDQEGAKIQQTQQSSQLDAIFKAQKQQSDLVTDAMNQFKTLTEALGIEAIAGAAPANLIAQQGKIIDEAQDNV